MNKVILKGNLGRDPEYFQSDTGKKVCKLFLATDGRGEEKPTDWHTVVCFDGTAESAGKYLKKGDELLLDGRIQTTKYENDEGKTIYGYQIVANSIEFLRKRNEQAFR